jgi:hypothetical protein
LELAYSAHVKFILVGAAVVMCAIALDLSLEASKQLTAELFGSRTEYDADADALEKVADRAESEGLISKYSFAFWTDSLDMTLDSALGSSDAAVIAFQVCENARYRCASTGQFASIWPMATKQPNANSVVNTACGHRIGDAPTRTSAAGGRQSYSRVTRCVGLRRPRQKS